jgi:hypothetical protein
LTLRNSDDLKTKNNTKGKEFNFSSENTILDFALTDLLNNNLSGCIPEKNISDPPPRPGESKFVFGQPDTYPKDIKCDILREHYNLMKQYKGILSPNLNESVTVLGSYDCPDVVATDESTGNSKDSVENESDEKISPKKLRSKKPGVVQQ